MLRFMLPVALVPMMASKRDRRVRRRKLLAALGVLAMAASSAVALFVWKLRG